MRVIEVTRHGGPEVMAVREVPDPVPAENQVVVEVSAIDVLFVDTRIRAGWGKEWFHVEPPYVPGNGVAGRIREVGAGVDESWLDRRVLAYTGGNGGMSPTGGYAERAVVPLSTVVPVPDRLGLPEALTLLHDGPTVVGVLDHAKVLPGERVLITGAGGGMGTLLIPMLAASGAVVVGAAKGGRKLDFVREWGAAEVVDYANPDWHEQVGPVDVVLDGVGGDIGTAAYPLLTAGGRFLAYGSSAGEFATTEPASTGVRVVSILDVTANVDRTAALTEMLGKAVDGTITPLVGQTFPLDRAVAAHEAIENRQTVGKTLLIP